MRSSTLVRALGILVLAIAIGGLIGWWASRTPNTPQPISEPTAPIVTAPAEPTAIPDTTTNADLVPPPEVASNTNTFDPALWDDKLDEILGDADDDTDRKARQMLDMMDKVSVEAQTEIAGHIVNLVNDTDFANRAAKYLTNSEVPEAVSSIFMNDLYNRDELMKLPLLLAVARNEKHALKDEAKDLLELYVEEDYGTNWNQWEDATKKYLKEHGSEENPTSEPATAQP
jgi:hypothetical protein